MKNILLYDIPILSVHAWVNILFPCVFLVIYCCLVTRSCSTLCGLHGLQHTRLPCPSLPAGICSNSCPLNWWWFPNILSSVILFSSCHQSLPAWRFFPMSQIFASGDQSIGVSDSASVLPMNIQDWFPLALTSLISLLSKGPSRVFSSTTVWKHQFFHSQHSLWSKSHIHTWLPEKKKKIAFTIQTFVVKVLSLLFNTAV